MNLIFRNKKIGRSYWHKELIIDEVIIQEVWIKKSDIKGHDIDVLWWMIGKIKFDFLKTF